MIAKLLARIGLDSSQFSSGIQGVQTQTQGLQGAFSGLQSYIVKAFSVAGVIAFANAVKRTADEIIRAKQEADVTGEGYQALRNMMRDAGQSADSLSGFLSKLLTASIDAQGGNAKLVGAFNALGISMQDLASMKTDEIFGKIGEAVSEGGAIVEEMNAVLDIFGTRMAAKVLPALKSVGEEGFGELTDRMKDAGRVMKDETLVRVNELETAFDSLLGKTKAFAANFLYALTEYNPARMIADMIAGVTVDDYNLDKMGFEEAQRLRAKYAEEAAEASKKQAQADAEAAAEKNRLADAQKRMNAAAAEAYEKVYAQLPLEVRLANAERELAQATEARDKAESAARENSQDAATMESYASALENYNSALAKTTALRNEKSKVDEKAAKDEENTAKATDTAREAYEKLAEAQFVASLSTQEQAEWHRANAERLNDEADLLGETKEAWDKRTEALRESATADSLFKQAEDEAARALDEGNRKIAQNAKNVQQLSEYVRGLSDKQLKKLVGALKELGQIAKDYDFSTFTGLESLRGFQLPANLTTSKIRQFTDAFKRLAEGLKDVSISVPEGLERLDFKLPTLTGSKVQQFLRGIRQLSAGMQGVKIDVPVNLGGVDASTIEALKELLDVAANMGGGGVEIELKAPAKEDLTLEVDGEFKQSMTSLAKSAATLASLKGVIYQ